MRSSGSWSSTLISASDSIPKKGADASDFGIRLDSYFMFLRFTAKNIRRLGENPSEYDDIYDVRRVILRNQVQMQ